MRRNGKRQSGPTHRPGRELRRAVSTATPPPLHPNPERKNNFVVGPRLQQPQHDVRSDLSLSSTQDMSKKIMGADCRGDANYLLLGRHAPHPTSHAPKTKHERVAARDTKNARPNQSTAGTPYRTVAAALELDRPGDPATRAPPHPLPRLRCPPVYSVLLSDDGPAGKLF